VNQKVLVLNQDYQALSMCSAERAFVLVYLRKAELVHASSVQAIHTVTQSYLLPTIIRLFNYVRVPYKKVGLSRVNIFRRDENSCQYCGSRHHLTLDHVIPKSRGGKDSWENLTTACQGCNTKKGDLTPEEAGMPLKRKPFRPSYIMFLRDFSGKIEEEWRPFLLMS
jgi:5-methylcytosine-specific restriction endonuclease McrA